MTDTRIAKLMWDAYAIQAGGKTFDGKPLPTWDELGEDRQSCWVAAASVTANRIEKLEAALRDLSDGWECCPVSQAMRRVARDAMEETK